MRPENLHCNKPHFAHGYAAQASEVLYPVSFLLLRINSLGHPCSQNAKWSKESKEAGFFSGVSRR